MFESIACPKSYQSPPALSPGGILCRNRLLKWPGCQSVPLTSGQTATYVQRPVDDTYGRQIGYQEGYVWINSYTGEAHAELVSYTSNGMSNMNSGNEIHSHHQFRSGYSVNSEMQPGSGIHQQRIHTRGVHVQQQSRSGNRPQARPQASASGVHHQNLAYTIDNGQ